MLFMVFAGVGLVALPLDLVQSFLGRPVAVITKSEYIKRARGLGQRAAALRCAHLKGRDWCQQIHLLACVSGHNTSGTAEWHGIERSAILEDGGACGG